MNPPDSVRAARKEAIRLGLKTYIDERPCKNGHPPGERFVRENRCVICYRTRQKLNARRYRREKPEACNAIARAYRRRKRGIDQPAPKNCQICDSCPGRPLHWDHCHATGKFRGWLCSNCNTALGLIKDSPAIAEKLAAYLRRRL